MRAVGTNMFGQPSEPPSTSLYLFHDEREVQKDWLYHGLLLISQENLEPVWKELQAARNKHDYWNEVHFSELTNPPGHQYGGKAAVAQEWVSYFVKEGFENFCFYVFGVKMTNINLERFGYGSGSASRSEAERTLYYRFLEIAIYSACRWFFDDHARVSLCGMFKDQSMDSFHPLERVPRQLNGRPWDALEVQFRSLEAVDSDHEKEDKWPWISHFIQYVDVIIGAVSQVLDAPSSNDAKCAVGKTMIPWVQRATNNPYNTNSRYYKSYGMSFFPKDPIVSLSEVEDSKRNHFFHQRELKLCNKDQTKLF